MHTLPRYRTAAMASIVAVISLWSAAPAMAASSDLYTPAVALSAKKTIFGIAVLAVIVVVGLLFWLRSRKR
jgi:hypothetical protein